jgi:hypothetical protein
MKLKHEAAAATKMLLGRSLGAPLISTRVTVFPLKRKKGERKRPAHKTDWVQLDPRTIRKMK